MVEVISENLQRKGTLTSEEVKDILGKLKSKGQDLKLGDKFVPYVKERELWIR